jgi:tRNA(Ile)-lysidine synthetase-like protein
MKFELAMKQAWERLPPEAALYCAVSGGLDSMAMLEAAASYRSARDPARRLVVLHVNHALRGRESDGDEAFVRAAASRLNLPIEVLRIEWKSERPTQESCRERREEFFRTILKSGDRLFLAHHLDDQAETIMQRLLRGSGLRGLAGMRPQNGVKIRPFLALSRAEIEAYARARGLKWREDSSNKSLKYERNWLRHEILPRLEERRPGVARRLSALAEEAAALQRHPEDLQVFALTEDWSFYRGEDLCRASSSALSASLRLSRLHTKGLEDLLRKGSGRYSAEGVGFCLSGGVLLAEKRPFAPPCRWRTEGNCVSVENTLGRWKIQVGADERVGTPSQLSLGDKAKKEFQRHRVPVFFRELVPLLVKEGRPSALLPGARKAQVDLAPLGQWWLKA